MEKGTEINKYNLLVIKRGYFLERFFIARSDEESKYIDNV